MAKFYNEFDKKSLAVTNKDISFRSLYYQTLTRTQQIFKYTGLPDSIPAWVLERNLQMYGQVVFGRRYLGARKGQLNEKDTNYYIFKGAPGGVPNVYYLPTIFIVSNPGLNYNYEYTINSGDDNDCVLIKNDTYALGLNNILYRYCSLIVESEISLRCALINSRLSVVLTAADEPSKQSVDTYIKRVINGELYTLGNSKYLNKDTINVNRENSASSNNITPIIEAEQYLKGSLFSEIGINSNFNLKRERLQADEAGLNDDALIPLIDNMLEERRNAIAEINEKYGLNITVELNSVWRKNAEEIIAPKAAEELEEGAAEELEEEAVEEPEEEAAEEPEEEAEEPEGDSEEEAAEESEEESEEEPEEEPEKEPEEESEEETPEESEEETPEELKEKLDDALEDLAEAIIEIVEEEAESDEDK